MCVRPVLATAESKLNGGSGFIPVVWHHPLLVQTTSSSTAQSVQYWPLRWQNPSARPVTQSTAA